MEWSHTCPADVWRMLVPASCWMFSEDVPADELIFHYRDHIYFVGSDGSVLALPKPACFEQMDLGEILDLLATSEDTIDFDDEGQFDYGFVLKQMGYVVPTKKERERAAYQIEIVNTIAPHAMITRYELNQVCFTFALYHALMRCHELNERSAWEFEHEVKRISRLEKSAASQYRIHS